MAWIKSNKILFASAIGSCAGGIVLIKEVLGGRNYTNHEDLSNKTVIITGANTGIGKQTAMAMASRKAKVILACRDMQKCGKAKSDIILETYNKDIHCEECDLASFESIRKFAKKINENEKSIDILINNAGVMRCPKSYTKEGIEMQLGVNHMGHFLLTNLLLPKIISSEPSRIVNVSSIAHMRGTINFDDLNSAKSYDEAVAYNQSKLANILFTKELAERLKGTRVTCNSLHPGIVNNELTRHMAIGKSLTASFLAKPILWLFIKTPRQGAQTTLHVALSPDLNETTGKYFSNLQETEPSKEAKDDVAAKRLWAISEKWTHLNET